MKLTGLKAQVFFDSFDGSKMIENAGTTVADKWYVIFDKGAGSSLPLERGFPFRAPAGAEQITLVPGDRVYPVAEERFCKTNASLEASQGEIDVGDDCDPGAKILDGNVQISGSLDRLFRYDDQTGKMDDVTATVINRFFSVVKDDGGGLYGVDERTDDPAYLLICLNSNAKIGQTENWLFTPAVISSMSISIGNGDAQSKSLSWSKGEGEAAVYQRVKTAA